MSRDELAGEHHFHGFGLAHGASEALGAARARHGADTDFRLSELSRFRGHQHIAGHGQLAAAAQRKARHRPNQRLAELANLVPGRKLVGDEHINGRFAGHLLNVGPGGEGPLVARNHHHAYRVVLVQRLQRVADFQH